jgi:hypothetical protein
MLSLTFFSRLLFTVALTMSDIESMSSDDSDNDLFTEEFFENIPDDSDSSDSEVYFDNTAETNSNLTLKVSLTFPTWKAAFNHIKRWAHYQGFFCS